MSKRQFQGVVSSISGDKTCVVKVTIRKPHPKYGKVVQLSKKLHAHDEKNMCAVGDEVIVVESRPMSRLKRWALKQIIKKADVL
jgi:small subunit ribosomal protein S17